MLEPQRCVASAASNFSCVLSLSSCQMMGYGKIFAWVAEWTLFAKPVSDPSSMLGFLKLDSGQDHAIPIISNTSQSGTSYHSLLLPGNANFFILDLSSISSVSRVSVSFQHHGGPSDVKLLSSVEAPPDDPPHCGKTICANSPCTAVLESCTLLRIASQKIILAVHVDAQSDRRGGVEYELRFAFSVSSVEQENFRCYSALDPRWFSINTNLAPDQVLKLELAPSAEASTHADPKIAVDLLTGEPFQAPSALGLYVSPLISPSPRCHAASCLSFDGSGCSFLLPMRLAFSQRNFRVVSGRLPSAYDFKQFLSQSSPNKSRADQAQQWVSSSAVS